MTDHDLRKAITRLLYARPGLMVDEIADRLGVIEPDDLGTLYRVIASMIPDDLHRRPTPDGFTYRMRRSLG